MSRVARLLIVAAAGLAVAGISSLRLPLCPLASTFGIPCPGCGLTRATLALLRGDVGAAYHFHPLVFVLAPLLASLVASAAWQFVMGPRGRRRWIDWSSRAVSAAGLALFGLILAVWVARFAGYFGGPVPVRTFRDWVEERSKALHGSARHGACHTDGSGA